MTVEIRERVTEPEVRVKTVPEVLRHAALVIEEQGWWGSTSQSTTMEKKCAWQAMVVAAGGPGGDDLLVEAASAYLLEYVDAPARGRLGPLGNGIELWSWNDAPGRTAAQVTAALRAAADAYESVR